MLYIIFFIILAIIGLWIFVYMVQPKNTVSQKDIDEASKNLSSILQELNNKQEILKKLQNEVTKMTALSAQKKAEWENLETLSRQAFEIYANNLLKEYEEKTVDHQLACANLDAAYVNIQAGILEEQKELETLRGIRYNAIAAKLDERKAKEAQDYYRLITPLQDNEDIITLNSIKDKLHCSALVNKVIWSQFRQKQLKDLFIKILGNNIHSCGIYKITNLVTDEVYIGQSVDFYERWMQHAKNACGVGSSTSGSLYKSMQQTGLDNFTWEIVEVCDRADLNEKEKAYIKLYCADSYGLNSTAGGS